MKRKRFKSGTKYTKQHQAVGARKQEMQEGLKLIVALGLLGSYNKLIALSSVQKMVLKCTSSEVMPTHAAGNKNLLSLVLSSSSVINNSNSEVEIAEYSDEK